MASLKEVKTRINSVRSTRKITSAMKMVASAKLHKAQETIVGMLPYQQKLNHIVDNFLGGDLSVVSPYTVVREVQKVAIVPFASNASLCGAFNSNVTRELEHCVEESVKQGATSVTVFPVGRKVEEFCKRRKWTVSQVPVHLADKPTYSEAAELAYHLLDLYAKGEVDKVIIIYHHFHSMGVQRLVSSVYLPLSLESSHSEPKQDVSDNKQIMHDYIVEPSASELVAQLIPTVLIQKLFTAAADSCASEHAARTMAMQMATDNADSLIQELTQQYNKGRQQAITNELLDIVGGSMK